MSSTLKLFALFVFIGLSALFRQALVQPPSVDPDHPFDTQATVERLGRILGDEAPHPVDSDASDGVIARLVGEIEALGFSPAIDEAFHCSTWWQMTCARVRNIGFWVGEPGPDAVMIASHHDSVPSGPGAADDGMGVAASLEIARIMAERGDGARPFYVLITDGEEIGLTGASHFVANSPVAKQIGAVVSLEARGNAGIATMFETSAPNGRDLAALHRPHDHGTKHPLTNSMAVDIYRAMPNGTDVTEYLKLDMDAANYSMIGNPWNYHTERDDMAHLDRAAVFHVGASALAAVEGLMGVDTTSPDTPKLYTDLWGQRIIALPAWTGLPLILLAMLACLVMFWRTPRQEAALWRVLLFPLLIIILGTAAGWLASQGMTLLRPESAPGTAYPIGLRGLQVFSALGMAAALALWLYRAADADRCLAAGWLWVFGMGLGLSLVLPGAAILYALPALLVLPAIVAYLIGQPALARILFAAAALLSLVLTLPMTAVAETALFIEQAALFLPLTLWVVVVSLPLVWRAGKAARPVMLALLGATAVSAVSAALVPAYSAQAPLGSNILHVSGDGIERPAYVVAADDPLPESLAQAAPFARGEIEGLFRDVWIAEAPETDMAPVTLTLRGDVRTETARTLSVRIDAPDADVVRVLFEGERPEVVALNVNGVPSATPGPAARGMECTGRACRTLDLVYTLAPDSVEPTGLQVIATRSGLGADSAAILAARPDWMGQQHDGNRRIAVRRLDLTGAP